MIYTNRMLEIINKEKGKKEVDLCSLYGKELTVKLDMRLSDYINEIKPGYHKSLCFLHANDEEHTLLISNLLKNAGTFLILDTLEYKSFLNDGKIYTNDSESVLEIVFSHTITNRNRSCRWDLKAIKVADEFSIFKILYTSGIFRYIVVNRGIIKTLTSLNVVKYLEEIGKSDIDVDKIDWKEV